MKWTKTEDIEFDIEELPEKVYAQLVPHVISCLRVGLSHDGKLYVWHEWNGMAEATDKQTLLEEIQHFAEDYKGEPDRIKEMIAVLDRAKAALLGCMTHNVESNRRAGIIGTSG